MEFNGNEIDVLWYLIDARKLDWNTSQDCIYEKFGNDAVQNLIIDSMIGYESNSFILTEIGEDFIASQMKNDGLGKNYTNPLDLNGYEDDPKDWLASSLIFASAIGLILRKNEGIVVKLKGDMVKLIEETLYGKVIVWNHGDQIHVIPCEEDLKDGQMIWMESPTE